MKAQIILLQIANNPYSAVFTKEMCKEITDVIFKKFNIDVTIVISPTKIDFISLEEFKRVMNDLWEMCKRG